MLALQDTMSRHALTMSNTVVDMQYGASVVVNINQALNDRITWVNSSKFFCNSIDRDHVNFEVLNRITVKLWKYIQLRLDTKLGYDPLMNHDLRFGQEVLLGFFYERQRSL